MLFERAEITTAEGKAEDFAAMMAAQGLPLLSGLPGVNSVRLGQGVEHPDKFMLLIHWQTMDDHIAFTKAEIFQTFLQLVGPYSVGGAMEHFVF
jgi:heme-degrading monooxygenase HmoA